MSVKPFCINCLSGLSPGSSVCPHCGFDSSAYEAPLHHLPPYTPLSGGRYVLGRSVGTGGFGITYLAFDTRLGLPAAIKELFVSGKVRRENTHIELLDTTGTGRRYYAQIKQRFIQEAMALAEMEEAAGLVRIRDYFEENQTAYIVMEYLDGRTLKEELKNRPRNLTMNEAVQLLKPVMEALEKLHRHGIIHRDVSLDNIMLCKDGRVKLIDLGGGKRLDETNENTVAIKKSAYTPVEQILGRAGQIGPQTDVYALSATLYRCVAGRLPKPAGERESDQDIVKPSSLGAVLTRQQEAALLKGLAVDPERRTRSVLELYQELSAPKKRHVLPVMVVAAVLLTGIFTAVLLQTGGPDLTVLTSLLKQNAHPTGSAVMSEPSSFGDPRLSPTASPKKPAVSPTATPSPVPSPTFTPVPTPAELLSSGEEYILPVTPVPEEEILSSGEEETEFE